MSLNGQFGASHLDTFPNVFFSFFLPTSFRRNQIEISRHAFHRDESLKKPFENPRRIDCLKLLKTEEK
jgi:hypothetical protein